MNNPVDLEIKTLPKNLRNLLEHRVQEARDIAETAARAALNQLGVGEAAPYPYLSDNQRSLRKRLRAHGRQLGDERNASTHSQEIALLVEEVAYQHWHRMLFACFLAENQLLMYPDPGQPVAVSLEECQELAEDEGARNGWELAARFAASMLPQIFRPDSPVFELDLPPEHQQRLEQLLNDLPAEIFAASDSLGWVYQFWQAKRKQEINDAGIKISSRELPAVTQLFTEDYMVSFLLDNSIGAWWAGQRLSQVQLQNANSEEELRSFLSLPGMPLKYLRFIKDEKGNWTPAAGTFSSWPKKLNEFKLLDPCCGSGHFLVAALLMLVPIRMEIEGLTTKEAVDAVIVENLHGLEIDQRCVELAAFNLALNAWRYPGAGGYRSLPELNVACSGLTISSKKEEWLELASNNTNLRMVLEEIYKQFQGAPILGSLINPKAGLFKGTLLEKKWGDIGPLLTEVLSVEKNDDTVEMGVVAHGLVKASEIMTQKYYLVTTNVPYLSKGKQSEVLSEFCDRFFSDSKNNLSNAFITRCLGLCKNEGSIALVTKDWQYQAYDKKIRIKLIKNTSIEILAWIGTKGFSTPMYDLNVVLMINNKSKTNKTHSFCGIDLTKYPDYESKALGLINTKLAICNQFDQLKNPDARITLGLNTKEEFLSEYSSYQQGICTGDLQRFIKKYWEIKINEQENPSDWIFQQSTVSKSNEFGGLENVLYWQNGQGDLYEYICDRLGESRVGSWIRGRKAWGKKGIAVSSTGVISSALYLGNKYDDSTMVLIPKKNEYLPAIWTFCSSYEFNSEVRKVDRKLNARSALVKVPFDLEYWQQIAEEKYPNGLPKPYSDDPTQWIFHGYPAKSEQPLQVAVARLLGYQWPAELDEEMELADEARELIEKSKDLLSYADKDGIVCIPAVGGEAPAAERLLSLLAAAYGEEWSNDMLSSLLANNDHAGKTLETWLRDKFFIQHCQLFHHRPFIWQIWDGLRDGFSVLVNYHHLDRKNLENLIYSYLGDWITRQKEDIRAGVDGAGEKLAAAESLKKRLELILEGEAPYDIFVRWKPIEEQPLGWEPDLNDGVRLNIRPFMSVPDVGKKGAGCLRDKPNIKWGKDRGKDVESAPWYHLFNGDRINDYHLSLAEKKDARMNW